jgi:D-lactate dehydrogenase (cytochrome)
VSRLNPEILAELISVLGQDHVARGASVLELHSHDESTHPPVLPDAVVFPGSTADVSAVAELANRHGIALTAFGAGTSLEGHTVPVHGGIVIDFARMNRVLQVHATDFQVTVQPGVLRLDLEKQLSGFGLFFPPDPGANASIGGMIANNAAGIRTVKYGATRDHVLALEVVLADGRIINTGSRSVKQSAGYDLTHLIVGSEGTLGLVTEATLLVYPVPEHFSTAIVSFPDVPHAAEAVYGIMGHGLDPAAVELVHQDHIAWMNEDEGADLPVAPSLMIEFTGPNEKAVGEAMTSALEICDQAGSTGSDRGLGREARNAMWRMRHSIRERVHRRFPGHRIISVDVAVPISRFPDLIAFSQDRAAARGLDYRVIGHAGDGNMHMNLNFAPDDAVARRNAETLNGELIDKALEMGGTSTGEHGIGIGKRAYLVAEHGAEAVAVMRGIKKTLDPNNILNPGKVLPDE